jgi:MFS family permease
MSRVLRRADYKWIALSNTTLGGLMAAMNASIILIALPAIFRGIGVNPLDPAEIGYLLWMLLGYMVVTAVFLVTFGRISDIYGRVRLYNAGFAVFTLGSIGLSLVSGHGNGAALYLILMRLVQGVGGGFLMANSAAILTDAFPSYERGMALGVNQIAAIGGSLAGLLLGGVLAAVDWRLVFLVSVPFGVIGTIWAYLMLKEISSPQRDQRIDYVGNVTFAVALTLLLVGITYGIMPYGHSATGWGSPTVVASLIAGVLALVAFLVLEARVPQPMFHLDLFKLRPFLFGNVSSFIAALARGGLQFMLVIWLQGIWLPIHGFSFEETPLWAAIYMIPLMAGFLVAGPLSGTFSDRWGARGLATAGLGVMVVGFVGLNLLPTNFSYGPFAIWLGLLGVGMGMFSSPNTASIMNAVPANQRGASSGMTMTVQNAATMFSMGLFFSVVIAGLAAKLPSALGSGLTAAGLPAAIAQKIAGLPPTAALFAAFLGYNPMGTLLPATVLNQLPAAARANLLSTHFFPSLMAQPFTDGLHAAFWMSAVLLIGAVVASAMRGGRYVHDEAPERAAVRDGARLQPATASDGGEGPSHL